MSIVLQSSAGGQITLQEPATASNFTQTLPAATGTVALTNAPVFTGQATIPTINLTGGQITFPATQSASSNANTLDDYEEGNWTPSLAGGTSISGQTGTFAGSYTKIGRVVTAAYSIILTAKGNLTGFGVLVTGLPFLPASGRYHLPANYENLATNWITIMTQTRGGTNQAYLVGRQSAGVTVSYLSDADIGNTTVFTGVVIYEVA